MKNFTSIALPLTGICLSCLVGVSCSSTGGQAENNEVKYVKTETVTESELTNTFNYVGVVKEHSSVALSFSGIGTVERVFVSEGDHVSKGQLVASLSNTSAQNILDASESAYNQAKDGYDRLKKIYDSGSLPEIQMVDMETKLRQAEATYNIARKSLDDCSLYAPFSGVVGKIMTESGENAIIGKTVLTILDISSVKIYFSVPENEISLIPANSTSEITIEALGNKPYNGKKVDKSVIANTVSHTYPAFVTLPNPQRNILPGMVCKIGINSGDKTGSIIVPIEVIMTDADDRKFVWFDDNGIARRKYVTTGDFKGNDVEISDGLSAGNQIITEGFQKISEGDKISVR